VVTEYSEDQLDLVLEALERMNAHLTAAVVSNDPLFLQASSIISVALSTQPDNVLISLVIFYHYLYCCSFPSMTASAW
jgi:hypothetical protein